MTLPRHYIPGATYKLTATVDRREFLLRPNAELNNMWKYCAARAQTVTGVLLHSTCLESNHVHAEATGRKPTDEDERSGSLSEFAQLAFGLFAKCLLAKLRQEYPERELLNSALWSHAGRKSG